MPQPQREALAPGRVELGHGREFAHAPGDRRKARQQHARVLALGHERQGEGAGDVRQSARLQQGKEFGADLQDSHRGYLYLSISRPRAA